MSENCGEWLGIYKNGWPMRSGHTSDCVSIRMLLVACAATHGRLHVVMHVSFSCTGTHPRPHVSQHAQISCIATHRPLHVSSPAPMADTSAMACHAYMHALR